jgi:hypothetical protein
MRVLPSYCGVEDVIDAAEGGFERLRFPDRGVESAERLRVYGSVWLRDPVPWPVLFHRDMNRVASLQLTGVRHVEDLALRWSDKVGCWSGRRQLQMWRPPRQCSDQSEDRSVGNRGEVIGPQINGL